MTKKFRILSLIMVLMLACSFFSACGNKKAAEKEEEISNVKPDDPMWHGNGMEAVPSFDEEGNPLEGLMPGDPRQEYSLQCRFDGKMDENSFEVTELDVDVETGEEIEGPILQLRIGNDSVREDTNAAEIGERMVVFCHYNEDSQLVAERIILLGN